MPAVIVCLAITALLVIGIRRRHAAPPGRTARAAMPMLPADVQAAVTEALRDQEDSTQVREMGSAGGSGRVWRAVAPAEVPPYLFVVRSGQVLTFNSLRELAWTRPDLLGVVFDRRWMGDPDATSTRRATPSAGAPSVGTRRRSRAG